MPARKWLIGRHLCGWPRAAEQDDPVVLAEPLEVLLSGKDMRGNDKWYRNFGVSRVLGCVFLFACTWPSFASAEDCVVLLHGWGRTSHSMQKLANAVEDAGFRALNLDYPSRRASVAELAESVFAAVWDTCGTAHEVHVVAHSMGGILVRQYFAEYDEARLGRVVMLGTPNQGTEAVNKLLHLPGLAWVLGPAGRTLGRGEDYIPQRLPPVNFELGIIAGTQKLNPLLSLLVENPDDGTVSVAATEVEGMCSHLVLPVTHSLMMRNDEVIAQTLYFLREGRFSASAARNGLCRHRQRH